MKFERITVNELVERPELQDRLTEFLEAYLDLESNENSDIGRYLVGLTEQSNFCFVHEKLQYYVWHELLAMAIQYEASYTIVEKTETYTRTYLDLERI